MVEPWLLDLKIKVIDKCLDFMKKNATNKIQLKKLSLMRSFSKDCGQQRVTQS